jgi:voltage-gated sodium channel type II alpha
MNNIKATGNSIKENHDNRLENSVIQRDDDALRWGLCFAIVFKLTCSIFSTKSYGSHKNHPYRNDSHKGSVETIDDDDTEGEEKRDASKEDLDQDGKS